MKKLLKRYLPKSLYYILKNIKKVIFSLFMYGMRILPIDNKKIIACNFNGKGYGDNPKYVCEALKDEKVKIVWLVKDYDKSMPNYINQVKYDSMKALFHLATAKVWIDNNRKELYIHKRKKQFYIQMWHGSISLKKIENDAKEVLSDEYINRAINDSKMIDLMISNSSFSDTLFSESFWYKGLILKSGTPRLDILFSNNERVLKEKFCNDLNINKEYGFIMYAPTFRDNISLEYYNLNYKKLIRIFEERYKKKFYLLLRLHPNLKNILKFDNIKESNVIDVSNYSDVYELMKISDILITDYSSLMFEFPMAHKKPVFIFATDLEEYNRGFYFDFDKLPFDVATNSNELVKIVKDFNETTYINKIENFYEQLKLVEDGHASVRVANIIRDFMKL